MRESEEAMLERMIHIVNDEHRPFSKMDFLDLMKPKTYRNIISKLKKDGIVKLDYKSSFAFHTLKGRKFGKTGTRNHMGVTVSNNDPTYNMLNNYQWIRHLSTTYT